MSGSRGIFEKVLLGDAFAILCHFPCFCFQQGLTASVETAYNFIPETLMTAKTDYMDYFWGMVSWRTMTSSGIKFNALKTTSF
jgi:hypothetical protein